MAAGATIGLRGPAAAVFARFLAPARGGCCSGPGDETDVRRLETVSPVSIRQE